MGNLQCGEMRELVGGAAENLGEPLDSFLMRHVYEGAVAKDIRQAVRAVVRLRDLLRRPKVPFPRYICQRKEYRKSRCQKNDCQIFSLIFSDTTALAGTTMAGRS
jgi:hypothetical protein